MPWLLRRLPVIAVTIVAVVMLTLILVPRLTSSQGGWLPAWSPHRSTTGFGTVSSFVGDGYRVSDLRALLTTGTPSTGSRSGLVRALREELRRGGEAAPDATVVLFVQPPIGIERKQDIRGWPIAWKETASMLVYTDAPGRSGLLADPDFPQRQPHLVKSFTPGQATQMWAQFREGNQYVGSWHRNRFPLALLAPIVLSVAAFAFLQCLLLWIWKRRSPGSLSEDRRRSGTKMAAWIAIVVLVTCAVTMATSRSEPNDVVPDSTSRTNATSLLGMTLAEFDRLGESPDADRLLAERMGSALKPEIPNEYVLLAATTIGQSSLRRFLSVGLIPAIGGTWHVWITTDQIFDATGAPLAWRGREWDISLSHAPNLLALQLPMPFDRSSTVRLVLWVDGFLLWITLAGVALYAARVIRHVYRWRVTRRRRRGGECLHCRYHVRPT